MSGETILAMFRRLDETVQEQASSGAFDGVATVDNVQSTPLDQQQEANSSTGGGNTVVVIAVAVVAVLVVIACVMVYIYKKNQSEDEAQEDQAQAKEDKIAIPNFRTKIF